MPTLNWIGKDKVINHHLDVPYRVLEHSYTYGVEDSGNMIIHGDNLEALKALMPKYEGQIKCIYIDPPYNTGNENWAYNDNVNDPKIRNWLGQVVGKEGEDLSRHDKWLCMMYPRLRLLQRLLAEKGVIFISIDDNEQTNLRLICDEIFGSNNFLANIVWKKKTNGNNMGHIPPVHDFIVVYGKNQNCTDLPGIVQSDEFIAKTYSNPDNDERGLWTTSDLSANHKGPSFEITNPVTGQRYFPPKGRYWVFNEDEVNKRIADGRIIFGKSGKAAPVQRVFLADRDATQKAETWFDAQGYNADGMTTLSDILGGKVLDHPKPTSLLEYIFSFATRPNDIILDSFAGSGTTAHAILNMNKRDNGNRKFILVEMEDYAKDITAKRIQCVINGYKSSQTLKVFEEKITIKHLKSSALFEAALKAKEQAKKIYGTAKNPNIKDGKLVVEVTGEKDIEGTGGGFDYYELGDPLMLTDGNLNEAVDTHKIREYVWYMETKQPTQNIDNADNQYYLGATSDTGYYFIYEKDRVTTLDTAFLSTVKIKVERYIIYADQCTLPEATLNQYNITFKKIPRDIAKL